MPPKRKKIKAWAVVDPDSLELAEDTDFDFLPIFAGKFEAIGFNTLQKDYYKKRVKDEQWVAIVRPVTITIE